MQPFPIFIGSYKELTSYSFLNIGTNLSSYLYPCASVLEAIFVTFSVFFSLKLEYPQPAANIWLLLQNAFFNVYFKSDKYSVVVKTLIDDLCVLPTKTLQSLESYNFNIYAQLIFLAHSSQYFLFPFFPFLSFNLLLILYYIICIKLTIIILINIKNNNNN